MQCSRIFRAVAIATTLLVGACAGQQVEQDDAAARSRATDTARGEVAARRRPVPPESLPPARRPRADMRLEVDVAARELRVYRGDELAGTYRVAVGTAEWPTRKGDWLVSQVVWNPEWNPPDESWADTAERKAPGAPDNPLGEAQLIYDPPRTIHGTNVPSSIGKAASHGSIRMRNAEIVQLARLIMEVAGVARDEAFYRSVKENRTEKVIIDLPKVVPIAVR
jgi:lipoprotein-anchoring transpeptidase ErfK/SrfK